jgi:hypothetical protein
VGLPGIEVTRRRDGERMLWSYLGIEATLERIGRRTLAFAIEQ